MPVYYRTVFKSGGLVSTLPNEFWKLGSVEGTSDPTIPNLALNNPSALTADLAVTETSDTVAINADVSGGTITAGLAATETSDTVAITGTNRTTASFAVTETADAVAITGSNRTTASLAVTETADTVSITGSNRTTATLAVTETADTVAITGSNRTTATLAATESADTVTINGTNATTASLAATETADTVSIAANIVGSTITASLAATETSDTVSFAASIEAQQDRNTGGGYWREHKPEYRVHPGYEDKPKPKRRKVTEPETIVLAPDLTVETGIVPVRPAWDVMAEMQQRADEAERIRRAKLRAIALADDDWLMVA